jgi:predicted transcriptional regulator
VFIDEYIVHMNKSELKNAMSDLGLSPALLAKLLDVTPRAVSLWLNGDRTVPGPAEAYLKLFASLSPEQQTREINEAKQEKLAMKDGMYAVEFQGRHGRGMGFLIFDNGKVFGSDVGLGKYDGSYTMNPTTQCADVKLRVEMPAGSESILGPAQPFSWNIDLVTSIDPTKDTDLIEVHTDVGQAKARYTFMRSLPE